MIVLTIVALSALSIIALSGRRTSSARQTIDAAIDRTAQGIAAASAQRLVPSTWPTGLLLRREPEIRAMNPETLGSYVQVLSNLGTESGRLTPEWIYSLGQARAEQLVRIYAGRPLVGLNQTQKAAMRTWLERLTAIGMPIDRDEQGLLPNLREDASYSVSGDAEHSDYAEALDLADAELRAASEAEEIEAADPRRFR